MSDQAVLTPEREDISGGLQERIREFTRFYEEHAYLAYNLALRITGEPGAAGRAVERGFLRQLDDRPAGLLAATTEAALRDVPAAPDATAAGDPEAQSLMAATSGMPPAERAALALAELADAGADDVGQALGVPAEQAAKLLERSRDAFASALAVSRDAADAAARDWMWAAPPDQIWVSLYQQFHRTVERRLRSGSTDQTLVLRPDAASAAAKAGRRARRRLSRSGAKRTLGLRRLRRPGFAVVAVFLGLGAVAASQLLGGDASEEPAALEQRGPADPMIGNTASAEPASGKSGTKPRKPLTAALLDKLRLRELRQLRKYSRRQADTSLPARQRRAAARRITAIERAARARLRAQQRREAAIRDREARDRARSQAPPPPATSAPAPPARPRPAQPSPTRTAPAGAPPSNREEAERSCLQDENTGQYICQQ